MNERMNVCMYPCVHVGMPACMDTGMVWTLEVCMYACLQICENVRIST